MDDLVLRPISRLRAEGWTDQRVARAVRGGELARVVRGVYGAAKPVAGRAAHLSRARAIMMRQGDSVVLSHESAAIAHGIPVENDDPPLVHLTIPPPTRGRRRSGYHAHSAALSDADVVTLHGVRVTSLTRTVIDLIRSRPFAWGVIAADWALPRGVRCESLAAATDAPGGAPGVPTLREVARFADGRAQSPAESVSRVTMMRAGVPTPELQCEVVGDDGWVATSDFAWRDLGVVGEVDGRAKYGRLVRPGRTPEDVIMEEKERDERIRQAGWWPCRWGWRTAWDVTKLGDRLRGAFAQPASRRRAAGR